VQLLYVVVSNGKGLLWAELTSRSVCVCVSSDGILLAPGNDTMNISLNNRSAESVLNSAQAVGILQSYSAILAAVPPAIAHKFGNLSTNITHLQMLETQQRESVEATWGGRWFARMWSPDSGGWFGTEQNASICKSKACYII
jgi:cellobiose phosphorylase